MDVTKIYGKDYRDRLAQAGFCVRVYNFTAEFGEEQSVRFGLQAEEETYIGSK